MLMLQWRWPGREGDHFGNFIRTAYWYVRPPRADHRKGMSFVT
jgi:hypothetical protein